MRLLLPVLGMTLGAGVCCCGDLLTAGLERMGIEPPAALSAAAVPGSLAEVPEYQGARYLGGASSGGISSGRWLVPGGDTEEIVDFYRLVLELDGWQVQHVLDVEGGRVLQARRNQSMLSITTSTGEGGDVQIVISVQDRADTG